MTSIEKQAPPSPDEALQDLLEGNQRYVTGQLKNGLSRADKAIAAFPKAVILSCMDARVPVETIFDQEAGAVFVVRVAGNIATQEILGSIEYALNIADVKLLLVLGHEDCGAVKLAMQQRPSESKHMDTLLQGIKPVVAKTKGKRELKDEAFLEKVIKNNVSQTLENIRNQSDLIKRLEKEDQIKISGAYYRLTSGEISILR